MTLHSILYAVLLFSCNYSLHLCSYRTISDQRTWRLSVRRL